MTVSDEERRLKALAQDHFRNSERLAKRCVRLEVINAELLEALEPIDQLFRDFVGKANEAWFARFAAVQYVARKAITSAQRIIGESE